MHLVNVSSAPMILLLYRISAIQVSPIPSSGARVAGVEARARVLAVAPVRYLIPCSSSSLILFLPAHVGSRGSGSKSGKPSKVPLGSGSLPNGKKSATSYGAGGGRAAPIPRGRPFAGRIAGGGNRNQVYGNRYAFALRLSEWRTPVLTRSVCEAYTGAATPIPWAHAASQDLTSRSSSGLSSGLALRLVQAHTFTTPMRYISTPVPPLLV